MAQLKNLVSTPLRKGIAAVCIIAALALVGTGTALAASAIARGNAIGAEQAQNFAFADAGVDPAAASNLHTEFEFEQGQFVYKVEFVADGTEYEYWIRSDDGTVVKKELELLSAAGTDAPVTAQITAEEAKTAALADAGLDAGAVTFTEVKLDRDGALSVYDVDFYTAEARYEYEINAATGVVYSKSKEITASSGGQTSGGQASGGQTSGGQTSGGQASGGQTSGGQTSGGQTSGGQTSGGQTSENRIGLEAAKTAALSDAGVSASEATFRKAKLDYDDGVAVYEIEFYTSTHKYEYEIHASTGKILSRDTEAIRTEGGGGNSAAVSVERAKSIAVEDAGRALSEVTFTKTKLERDDGRTVYEIEFFAGDTEYEYTIDAASGAILERSAERED